MDILPKKERKRVWILVQLYKTRYGRRRRKDKSSGDVKEKERKMLKKIKKRTERSLQQKDRVFLFWVRKQWQLFLSHARGYIKAQPRPLIITGKASHAVGEGRKNASLSRARRKETFFRP